MIWLLPEAPHVEQPELPAMPAWGDCWSPAVEPPPASPIVPLLPVGCYRRYCGAWRMGVMVGHSCGYSDRA